MLHQQILHVLESINHINTSYAKDNQENLKEFSKGQSPIATLIMCCDSRAHTTSFTYNPENNFFIVRNIGNQYILNQGCVEFGIRVLKTPLLIFMGHTQCGAINASMSNYAHLPSSIIREIDHLALSIKKSELHGNDEQRRAEAVVNNVSQQVELAMKDFADLLDKNELTIIGMVLDIDNSLHEGLGRISVINVNGETDRSQLASNPLVANFFTHRI